MNKEEYIKTVVANAVGSFIGKNGVLSIEQIVRITEMSHTFANESWKKLEEIFNKNI